MTQSSVCGPPMLKRKPKLFFSTFRISKNIIKNKNKLHTPHCSPVPSGRLPQLDSVVVRGLQIPLPAIPTGISLNLSLYLNQFVLIYNYLSITQLILFFFFLFIYFLCCYHTKISHWLRISSFQNYINVKCHFHPLGHSLSHKIVSYRYCSSEFYIEGVCSDLPLVRLVQKGLFNFGKEKRHDILVNNSRDAH